MATVKSNIVAEVLVGSLTAVAFEEMVRAVHESAENHGITFGTGALTLIFALTTIRFLVGNLLYLHRMAESTWFYDLLVIVTQAVALAFLGGLSVREKSIHLRFSFFGVLCIVLVIDLCWTLTHLVLKKREPSESADVSAKQPADGKPKGDPLKEWLMLNSGLLALIAIFGRENAYSYAGLVFFSVANVSAFVLDCMIQKKHGFI